jgi:type VI secretion system protein ImpK
MKRPLKINPLLECCASLFAYAALFKRADRGAKINPKFRRAILAGFDEMERKAFEMKIPMQKVKEAKFALASYVDESVLTSNWPGRMEWMSKTLQLTFFGEHIGGEAFFKHLNALRRAGDRFVDVMEVYYVCLQLGFEGMYRLRGLEQLMALQVDLRSQIEGYRKYADNRLSPDGVPKESVMATMRREIPYWVIGTVTLACVFFTYLGYAVVTEEVAKGKDADIASMQQQMFPEQRTTHDERTLF